MVAFSLELETGSCWDEMSLERFKAFKQDMTFVIFLFCYLCEKKKLTSILFDKSEFKFT